MKLNRSLLIVAALALVVPRPALAQVEAAVMRTVGIDCGICAAASEISLRRIEGVEKVTISKSNESVLIAYGSGALFQPQKIREAFAPLHVGIELFQVRARGHLEERDGKQFFVAGKNRFLLTALASNAVQLPSDTTVVIEAVLKDRVDPMELTVLTFRADAQELTSRE